MYTVYGRSAPASPRFEVHLAVAEPNFGCVSLVAITLAFLKEWYGSGYPYCCCCVPLIREGVGILHPEDPYNFRTGLRTIWKQPYGLEARSTTPTNHRGRKDHRTECRGPERALGPEVSLGNLPGEVLQRGSFPHRLSVLRLYI